MTMDNSLEIIKKEALKESEKLASEFSDLKGALQQIVFEKKRSESALHYCKTRFRRISDSNMVGVLFWDTQGQITEANDALLNMIGYSREDIQHGRLNWIKLTPPEYRDRDYQAYQELLSGKVVPPYEKQYMCKDGSRKDVLIANTLLETTSECGIACIVDITAFKQIEKQLTEAKNRAETENLKKNQFLSLMSHELRTPLNTIIGYADMLSSGLGGNLSEKQEKYIQNILVSSRNLLNMINDILDLTKVEVGHVEIQPERVELASLIQDLQGTFQKSAWDKGVTLFFQVESGLNEIFADPLRLRQICMNLLNNAIKFNRQDGWIIFKVQKNHDGSWIIFEIEDSGIGIPQEKISELFKPFYQVDADSSRQYQGTGLGLTLSKYLIELHGGCISVKSEVGQGSTFTFRLPNSAP